MVTKKKDIVILNAVGDVVVNREDPKSMWALVAPIIRQSDIAFCQLEAPISDKYGYLQTHGWGPPRSHPRTLEAFTGAGFNVISYASNNAMDWGPDCFLDTIEKGSYLKLTDSFKGILSKHIPGSRRYSWE
jgi:poly-gamma-glutamate capsule biosynthesis protein CapA/YwtB (metallophosphatase superfamily)